MGQYFLKQAVDSNNAEVCDVAEEQGGSPVACMLYVEMCWGQAVIRLLCACLDLVVSRLVVSQELLAPIGLQYLAESTSQRLHINSCQDYCLDTERHTAPLPALLPALFD